MVRLCFDYGHGGTDSGAVYKGRKESDDVLSLASKIQQGLVGVGFRGRGVKAANFHVLRETKSPAVLIEIGFIDNTKDNILFDSKFDEIVKSILKAILLQLGMEYREVTQLPPTPSNILYQVMAGSYSVRENADAQIDKLKRAGFDATIMIFNK